MFLAFIHTSMLVIRFEEWFHQDTMQIYPSIYSYFYSLDLFFMHHQPSTSTPYKV
jgi:hypothetical protein